MQESNGVVDLKITEIKFTVVRDRKQNVLAYVNLVFERCFAVRDLRIISVNDRVILAMPNKELSRTFCNCGFRIPLGSRYCAMCGKPANAARRTNQRSHYDIAHPLDADYREYMEATILDRFSELREKLKTEDESQTVFIFDVDEGWRVNCTASAQDD